MKHAYSIRISVPGCGTLLSCGHKPVHQVRASELYGTKKDSISLQRCGPGHPRATHRLRHPVWRAAHERALLMPFALFVRFVSDLTGHEGGWRVVKSLVSATVKSERGGGARSGTSCSASPVHHPGSHPHRSSEPGVLSRSRAPSDRDFSFPDLLCSRSGFVPPLESERTAGGSLGTDSCPPRHCLRPNLRPGEKKPRSSHPEFRPRLSNSFRSYLRWSQAVVWLSDLSPHPPPTFFSSESWRQLVMCV